ncbi:MAG: glycosyltransferase family 2 protein [Candidatus Hodarchaeota archaeon]
MEKKQPLISIITPSLNQGEYIEDTIKSVLNQSYPNFEHIIIDGDSTDGTIDILKKYDHLIWVSEKDGGQSEAINKGFKKAKGEIIGWLNSDDCYKPNAFFTIVQELNRAENKYVVFGDCYVIDAKGNRIGYVKGQLPHPKDWLKYWKKDYRIPSASVFFYKEIFQNVGYLDENIHYVMDDDFFLRINEHYRFHYIKKPLGSMRIHDRAKTPLRGEMYEREWFRILKKKWAYLPLASRYVYLFKALSFRSNIMREGAYSTMEELSLSKFRKKILLSIVISPPNLFKRRFLSALLRSILGHEYTGRIKRMYS